MKHIERWYFSNAGNSDIDPLDLLNSYVNRKRYEKLRIISIETAHTDTANYLAYIVWVEIG